MPYAFSPCPVNEPHVALVHHMFIDRLLDIQLLPERGVPYKCGKENLVAGVGMPEHLLKPVFL